jgi:hypothetical protein
MNTKKFTLMKVIGVLTFVVAMVLNLSSNAAGELSMNSAYATETGGTSGTESKKEWSYHWPACTGTRICKGKSVSYNGVKFTCIKGSLADACDDSNATCDANTPCPN